MAIVDNLPMMKDRRYELLRNLLIEARLKQGLTQTDVAFLISKPQSYVSKYESGERRIDVVEFLDVCKAIEVDFRLILKRIS